MGAPSASREDDGRVFGDQSSSTPLHACVHKRRVSRAGSSFNEPGHPQHGVAQVAEVAARPPGPRPQRERLIPLLRRPPPRHHHVGRHHRPPAAVVALVAAAPPLRGLGMSTGRSSPWSSGAWSAAGPAEPASARSPSPSPSAGRRRVATGDPATARRTRTAPLPSSPCARTHAQTKLPVKRRCVWGLDVWALVVWFSFSLWATTSARGAYI